MSTPVYFDFYSGQGGEDDQYRADHPGGGKYITIYAPAGTPPEEPVWKATEAYIDVHQRAIKIVSEPMTFKEVKAQVGQYISWNWLGYEMGQES